MTLDPAFARPNWPAAEHVQCSGVAGAGAAYRIRPGYILPSAAFTIHPRKIAYFRELERIPQVGDVVYGQVSYIGAHSSLENKEGRIHLITDRTRAVFVYGNRYAPDAFEGHVPDQKITTADLLARSGVIGIMREKNTAVKDPTKVEVLGHVIDGQGNPIKSTDYPIGLPRRPLNKSKKRAKMILHVGTSMNSGKSTSAIACCWALAAKGFEIRASKVTGTASLKDVLHMQDVGAGYVSDFSHLGFPSTYLLPQDDLLSIFEILDAKYAGNPKRFWIVEFADGILQRETAMLLRNEYVRSRIHRLIFSASDAFGALGGLNVLKEEFGLTAHAISGRCTSSPLMVREIQARTDVPVYDNVLRDLNGLCEILI